MAAAAEGEATTGSLMATEEVTTMAAIITAWKDFIMLLGWITVREGGWKGDK